MRLSNRPGTPFATSARSTDVSHGEFVVDTRLDGDSRLVTFAEGTVVRERIVDIDDSARRIAYSVVEWRATHHNASIQVFADGNGRTRLVWITDLLPNELAEFVGAMMEQGCAAMKRTLESSLTAGVRA